jgi:RNA recognition motif-containing protein
MRTKKLLVSGLPESLTEENLYDLFDLYGCIEDVRLAVDAETRSSMGYGEIIFRAEDCARDALEAVDGLEIMGARLMVRPALVEDDVPSFDDGTEIEFVSEISRPLWDRTRKAAVS